jgi:ribonuclease Z
MRLVMLGTGCATAVKCYNTCFALESGGEYFLTDAGGGNGIIRQLKAAGIDLSSVRSMFITHCHTDHLLGAVWIIRYLAMFMLRGKYAGYFSVYGHDKAAEAVKSICDLTLPESHRQFIGQRIRIITVKDGESRALMGMRLSFFDILSTKDKQYGFRAELPSGRVLCCLGDEPYNPVNRPYVENCDWLLTEAFCLYAHREIFKPYEKRHSTALDAGKTAEALHARNLVLYHTEDSILDERKKLYAAEAEEFFSGAVYVPDDLDSIELDA